MLLPIALGTALFSRGKDRKKPTCPCTEKKLGCYDVEKICWKTDLVKETKKQLCCVSEFADRGLMNWRTDPVLTAAAYLNQPFIKRNFRGRECYLAECSTKGELTYVLFTFDNGGDMAFCLTRPKGCGKIWRVVAYAYLSAC